MVSSAERSDWGVVDDSFNCNNASEVLALHDFLYSSLGRIGKNRVPGPRTYSLPPHYGLGVINIYIYFKIYINKKIMHINFQDINFSN